jgi:serine protease Do
MKENFKKIGITLLTAIVGGAVAIGAYKLVETNRLDNMGIQDRQGLYFTNNPSAVNSDLSSLDFTEAAAAVSPGVVHIRTTYSRNMARTSGNEPFGDMFEDFFGRRQRSAPQQTAPGPMGKGSGVIVTDDGYIMTNNHVVEDAEKIEVILSDKRVLQAKVIGRDKNTDLALIKVSATDLPIVRLGNSDNVKVGEWVLAVGYPLTLESTVTAGIVSAKSRKIGILAPKIDRNTYNENDEPITDSSIESFIQTDAVINRGNSGGALVNTKGELIGINSAIASQSGTYEGYGFAIPVNLAKKVMDDFLKYGEIKRAYIGVTFQELNFDNAEALGTKEIDGLYVNSTLEGGAAASAGIKKGDIIKKLNNQTITSSSSLQEKVGIMRPGDKVSLTVLRDGSLKNFNLTLKGDDGTKLASSNTAVAEASNSLGASFAPINDAIKKKYGVGNGVIVQSVLPGKVFDMYDIPKGTLITTVNGKAVNNNDQVIAALKQDPKMVSLIGIVPDGSRFRVTFPVK